MGKNVAIIAVNPVNGSGLFQYLEAFYENGISYKVFAVAETKEISTNSGIAIRVDDVIANLKGNEDQFDALVFACGDAMPVFSENASAPYNQDMMQVIATFGQKDKILIGHCVGGMLFDFAGAASGKKLQYIRWRNQLYNRLSQQTKRTKWIAIFIPHKLKTQLSI